MGTVHGVCRNGMGTIWCMYMSLQVQAQPRGYGMRCRPPPTCEGRDLALARSARHSALRALSEGPRVACRHAAAMPLRCRCHAAAVPLPCRLYSWSACGSHARAPFRARGRQRVHRYSECALRHRRSSPRKHPFPPFRKRVQRGGGAQGLRATPAGRAHPSARLRNGG